MQPTDDPLLISAYTPLVGSTLGSLDQRHGHGRPKHYRRMVIDDAIESSAPGTWATWEANYSRIKAVPVRGDLWPHEDTSFAGFTLAEITAESWPTCRFAEQIESLLFLPVEGPGPIISAHDDVLLDAVPWSPATTELAAIENEWTMFRDHLRVDPASIPTASSTRYIHIRPHASDSSDLDLSALPDVKVHSSFWLNRAFVQAILQGRPY